MGHEPKSETVSESKNIKIAKIIQTNPIKPNDKITLEELSDGQPT